MLRIVSICAIGVAAGVFAVTAHAAEPKTIGQFGDWSSHTLGQGKSKVCYVHSEPTRSKGKYKKRDRVFIQAAHRPSEKVRGEVSVTAGYTYKTDSAVLIGVDKRTYKLFTHKDGAWLRDAKSDAAVVRALRKGRKMFVTGRSSRGTKTTDTYSLKGFSAAYTAINKACGYK